MVDIEKGREVLVVYRQVLDPRKIPDNLDGGGTARFNSDVTVLAPTGLNDIPDGLRDGGGNRPHQTQIKPGGSVTIAGQILIAEAVTSFLG